MINYKAVIFDLDGTLINSLEDIADSVNKMLIESGYPTFTYNEYRFFVGNGFRNLVKNCLPEEDRNELNLSHSHSIAMNYYRDKCINKTHIYEGISELLDYLSRKKMSLAILSNKPEELTQKTVKTLLNNWKFNIIMGASERFPRKPNPSSALHIIKTLGSKPNETLYIGDSNVDMKTANTAGFYSIGVTWGFRPRAELEESGAKLIVDTPTELINQLNILLGIF